MSVNNLPPLPPSIGSLNGNSAVAGSNRTGSQADSDNPVPLLIKEAQALITKLTTDLNNKDYDAIANDFQELQNGNLDTLTSLFSSLGYNLTTLTGYMSQLDADIQAGPASYAAAATDLSNISSYFSSHILLGGIYTFLCDWKQFQNDANNYSQDCPDDWSNICALTQQLIGETTSGSPFNTALQDLFNSNDYLYISDDLDEPYFGLLVQDVSNVITDDLPTVFKSYF